jgi:hypothetical protein
LKKARYLKLQWRLSGEANNSIGFAAYPADRTSLRPLRTQTSQ